MSNRSDAALSASKPPSRRLLVVSYHFPPDGAVGGLRWAGMTKYLRRLGWEVEVITGAAGAADNEPGVHRIARRETLNDAYNAFAQRRRSRRAPAAQPADRNATAHEPARPSLLGMLRQEISSWLVYPDISRGWIWRAARFARRRAATFRPDVIVSSGPPHSAHVVARAAAAAYGIPHIMDLRDPWVSFLPDHQKTAATSGGLRRALSARLERLCLRHARAVITNSQHLAGEMRAAFPNLAVCWIPNGTDPERLPRTEHEPFPGLSLAYVGSLYVGRDLQPVLRALQLFLRRNPDAQADGTRLRVAGAMAPEHQARFVAQVEELALQKHVEFLGTLPPADALTLLHRSTLAIVLAQQQRMQVPAKIYESVSLHVPTLVVTESDSASAKESDRIGAISIEPDNIEAMVTLFEELWSGSRPRRTPPRVPVDYAGLAEEMARTLNSVIEPAHAHNG